MSKASPRPISRLTTSDRVAAALRRNIWNGELRSGQRLNQDELAEALGVSRIPVREALMTLAAEGTVSMTPHRGAFVEQLDEVAVRDHYALFAHVDGFALRRTVERASIPDRMALAEAMFAVAELDDLADLHRQVTDCRSRFHALGGSPRFAAVARVMNGLVPGNFFAEVEGTAAIARERSPLVAAALKDGDAEAAVAAYGPMLTQQGELVIDTMRTRGLLVGPRHEGESDD